MTELNQKARCTVNATAADNDDIGEDICLTSPYHNCPLFNGKAFCKIIVIRTVAYI